MEVCPMQLNPISDSDVTLEMLVINYKVPGKTVTVDLLEH